MADIRTIKIFLASSEELENDRNAFGNLVRRLDKIYEKRGIRIELFEWEDYDAAYNNRRKQDEYNDQVRASDMFLALFHIKAGKYTIEEFNVAKEEFRRTSKSPKSYVYCRDLQGGEKESAELVAFKHRLFDEMGYYWCRYNNKDSLQLHFVMQLQLVENNRMDDLKVQDGNVCLGDTPIARMDSLRFAAGNEDYRRMSQRLAELPEKIEKKRLRIEKYPDDKDLQDELQELLNERNHLQEVFEQQQQFLFDTAKRIAQLQGGVVTDRMRRAMDAFEDGNVRETNIILDEAERDADKNLVDYKRSKEITEQKLQNVLSSIDELLLKTTTIMADMSIAIEERIAKTMNLYQQADHLANEVDYDKEQYDKLLFEYAVFLNKYGKYKEAEGIYLRQIALSEELYGNENTNTAISYNNIGGLYRRQGNYSKALEYDFKALEILEKVLGKEHSDTATSYNNIGAVYDNQGNYAKALEFYFKALEIFEKVLGRKHPYTAWSYNNIGFVYYRHGDYAKALEYYFKALEIREKVLGKEHPDTSQSYNNIGLVYYNQGNYAIALEYYFKAVEIREKVLGKVHPNTANSYNNIGNVYNNQGDYDNALEYHFKALEIREKVLGKEHPDTATSYNNIGLVYDNQGDYAKALKYYSKDMEICEKVLGKEHPDTATSYNNIGGVYNNQGYYKKALEYYFKALEIREKVLGKEHPDTATSYNNIAFSHLYQEDYQNSLEYFTKALLIWESKLGAKHPYTLSTKVSIYIVKAKLGDKK